MLKKLTPYFLAILMTPLSALADGSNFSSFTLKNVMLQQGSREILLNFSYESSGSTGGGIDLETGFGYFIQDFIQAGFTVLYSDTELSDAFGGRIFGEHNYDTFTNWIPFAGGSLGYLTLDPGFLQEDNSGIEFRIYVGAKIFLTEYLAVTGTLGAAAATDDVYLDNVTADSSKFDAKIGVRVWF